MKDVADEWTAEIEELEQEIIKEQQNDRLMHARKLIIDGSLEKAKKELLEIRQESKEPVRWKEIDYLLSLMTQKTVRILVVSVPLIIAFFAFYSSIFNFIINMKFMIPKWFPKYHETHLDKENWADFLSELSIILVLGPSYAIKMSKKIYPSLIKPVIPWKLSIPISIFMAIFLAAIHDVIFVTEYLALHSIPVSAKVVMRSYLEYTKCSSVGLASLHSFFNHILMSIGMVATILIGYYGKLSKEASEGLEAINELSGSIG